MILSGRYLGEIIDAFGTIAERAELRAKIGFTDLHRVLEDFFMTILNELNDSNLENTNRETSNSAGIDLYDANSKIGFQITTVGTTQKINETLRVVQERIIGAERFEIETLYVLVIGKKQGSYTLDTTLCPTLNFNEKENIWDIVTLSQKLIGIKPDVLERIYKFVMRELTRVRIELELPNSNGEYPTDLGQFMELRPSRQLGECSRLRQFVIDQEQEIAGFESVISDLRTYFQGVGVLPRITRQVLGEIIDSRELVSSGKIFIVWEKFERACKYPDLKTEISILEYDGYLRTDAIEETRISKITIMRDKNSWIYHYLVPFLAHERKTFNKLFSTFDFSIFENT